MKPGTALFICPLSVSGKAGFCCPEIKLIKLGFTAFLPSSASSIHCLQPSPCLEHFLHMASRAPRPFHVLPTPLSFLFPLLGTSSLRPRPWRSPGLGRWYCLLCRLSILAILPSVYTCYPVTLSGPRVVAAHAALSWVLLSGPPSQGQAVNLGALPERLSSAAADLRL